MNVEQARYERLWGSVPEYRAEAPGTNYVRLFLDKAKAPAGASFIDFGCGTGRAARDIWILAQDAKVTMLDFAGNCLDPLVDRVVSSEVGKCAGVKFQIADLTKPIDVETGDYGYCTDVMEHIAPEDVDAVLRNVLTSAKRVFFAISTVPDYFGPAVDGHPLHLTVEPHSWWRDKIKAIGARIDWEEDRGAVALFYASLYANGDDYSDVTGLNVTEDRVRENILANLRLGVGELCPHDVQLEQTICVLAGGPSLADHEAEIIERGKRGEIFVTANGTYKWLIDRGIKPAAQLMVDARPFNARFVEPVIDTCRYIFSSQAAHEAVAKVPAHQALLFHSGDTSIVKECFDAHCKETGKDKAWYPVYGGSTVIGRGLVALAMLGFRKIEVFGWDSCLRGDEHHAYSQPENDEAQIVDISIGGKSFKCHPWMVVQANEVPKLIRHVLGKVEGLEIAVRGDGLIAHMLNYAAEKAMEN